MSFDRVSCVAKERPPDRAGVRGTKEAALEAEAKRRELAQAASTHKYRQSAFLFLHSCFCILYLVTAAEITAITS